MKTRNRGKETGDDLLFGDGKMIVKIAGAIRDVHYLLSRNYPEKASSELAGRRYMLKTRQIKVVSGAAASQMQLESRQSKQLNFQELKNRNIYLDGFNVIILLESLLSGAYLFQGLDGCFRDLSGVHGTYKRVNQTQRSIELVASFFLKSETAKLIWVFDKPVSNSGRIKQMIADYAEENQLKWEVILKNNPDKYLAEQTDPVISLDAWILDHCESWFNLIEYIIINEEPEVNAIKFNPDESI